MNRLTGALRVDEYAGRADFPAEKPQDIVRSFAFEGTHRVQPGGEAIEKVLERMGKTSPDKQLNCGSCGYPTCRDKAIAVCQGKAEIGMCLSFLKERAESFSDTVIGNTPNAVFVLDENLVVQQVNRAALELFGLNAPDEILHAPIITLLNPTDYMNVMLTGKDIINKCLYVAEFKIYVEETIVYDRQNRVLVCILRDVTERERIRESERMMRRQTIEITDKVIDKQMRAVQEIASLLGETTAETKTALTRLKDAMQHE
jgi:PAS domain S-box-containing protein